MVDDGELLLLRRHKSSDDDDVFVNGALDLNGDTSGDHHATSRSPPSTAYVVSFPAATESKMAAQGDRALSGGSRGVRGCSPLKIRRREGLLKKSEERGGWRTGMPHFKFSPLKTS